MMFVSVVSCGYDSTTKEDKNLLWLFVLTIEHNNIMFLKLLSIKLWFYLLISGLKHSHLHTWHSTMSNLLLSSPLSSGKCLENKSHYRGGGGGGGISSSWDAFSEFISALIHESS